MGMRDRVETVPMASVKSAGPWNTATIAGALARARSQLVGRATWQQSRVAQFNAQKPTVEKIMNAQALATRIEDLSTKRLLPMEMISVVAAKIPGNIRFSRVVTDAKELERVIIDARTENSGEIPLFKSALEALPEVAHVEITNQRGAQTTTFTLTTTFKPGAIKPAAAP